MEGVVAGHAEAEHEEGADKKAGFVGEQDGRVLDGLWEVGAQWGYAVSGCVDGAFGDPA